MNCIPVFDFGDAFFNKALIKKFLGKRVLTPTPGKL
jgi:hypothetical protein